MTKHIKKKVTTQYYGETSHMSSAPENNRRNSGEPANAGRTGVAAFSGA
ncbi:MAG: hypothetical protein M0Z41_15300 [Peptococcaceae bacterium]|jgi:hypothetical protein|nr:hypothetical protein [Peptococcaceae bacterium]